jgi:hypothetical protein
VRGKNLVYPVYIFVRRSELHQSVRLVYTALQKGAPCFCGNTAGLNLSSKQTQKRQMGTGGGHST